MVAIDLDRRTTQLRLSGGATVNLDATYLDEGHLDHGYALTAHKAQGATVDRAFVLGSDQLSREWGYTALSRHRDEVRFYLVSPASVERNLPDVEQDDPLTGRLVEMLGDSHAKTLALDHVAVDEPDAAENALARFRVLLAGEHRAAGALQLARDHLEDTRERLDQTHDERAALGRIFHRHERAALDTHVAGNERALAYWQERVERGEERLGAALESREAWLTEHGETTLALLRAERAANERERDALRDELAATSSDRRLSPVAERDDLVRDALAPEPEPFDVSLPAPDIDVGPDLGP